jgi:bacillithiol biosynthesis cysteine-adding enzyme BshC
MIPAFGRELTENVAFTSVTQTNEKLGAEYGIQVNPRDINLFYLRDGRRNRITREGEVFSAVGTEWQWNEQEILEDLKTNPERFSPNVMLRPLYQETILPNLGYIGGGGEVAYWAQLKQLFQIFEVPFPIVVLRQSVQLVPKRISQKLEKLQVSELDLFTDQHELSRMLISRQCDYASEINTAEHRIAAEFAQVAKLAGETDTTLVKHVEAQMQRALNSLEGIEKKMFRAAKRNEGDALRRVQECRDVLQPGGGLQERHDNILQHLLEFGPDIITTICNNIKPLDFEFISLNEA